MKSPVFPWSKFPGVDTVLGPEMKSTGEVMGVADNFGEAFAKAQIAAGNRLPTQGTSSSASPTATSRRWSTSRKRFVGPGLQAGGDHGTARVLEDAGLTVERVYKVKEGRPNVVDLIKGDRIQLIINTPHGADPWFDEKRFAAPPSRITSRRSPRCPPRAPPPKASPPCNTAKPASTRCRRCTRSAPPCADLPRNQPQRTQRRTSRRFVLLQECHPEEDISPTKD